MKKVTLIVDGRKFNFVKDNDEETAESCECCAFMGTGWCGAVCTGVGSLIGAHDETGHFEKETNDESKTK